MTYRIRPGATREYADRLNKCTLCMVCTANCPAKANIPNVIVAARADAVKARGLKFPYNIIYRWLLPRRKLFGWVVRFASWFQGIFMPRTEGTVRHLSLFLSALGKGRNIPQIAPKFLRQSVPVVNSPPEGIKATLTVGYFSGCMTDFVFPELGSHIIEGTCQVSDLVSTGDWHTNVEMPLRDLLCGPAYLSDPLGERGREQVPQRHSDATRKQQEHCG